VCLYSNYWLSVFAELHACVLHACVANESISTEPRLSIQT
jgi:hypothetical protein